MKRGDEQQSGRQWCGASIYFCISGENWNVVSLHFFLSDDGALHLGELESLRVHEPHDL